MATLAPVDLGSNPDDGTGDNLRAGGVKLNANDLAMNTELVALLTSVGAATGVSDLGVYGGPAAILTDNGSVKAALEELEASLADAGVLSGTYVPDNTGAPAVGDPRETAIAKLHHLVNLVNESMRFAGSFDASAGAFPTVANGGAVSGNTVEAGYVFVTTVAGTHDGETFNIGDRLLVMADGGDAATFAGNYAKLDSGVDFDTALPIRSTSNFGVVGTSGLASHSTHEHPVDVTMVPVTTDGASVTNTIENLDLSAPGTSITRTLGPTAGTSAPVFYELGLIGAGSKFVLQPQAGETLNGVVDKQLTFDSSHSSIKANDLTSGWSAGPNVVTGGKLSALDWENTVQQNITDGLVTLGSAASVADGFTVGATAFTYTGGGGRFLVTSNFGCLNISVSSNATRLYLRKNGVPVNQSFTFLVGSANYSHNPIAVVDLATGDTIDFNHDGQAGVAFYSKTVTIAELSPDTYQTGTLIASDLEAGTGHDGASVSSGVISLPDPDLPGWTKTGNNLVCTAAGRYFVLISMAIDGGNTLGVARGTLTVTGLNPRAIDTGNVSTMNSAGQKSGGYSVAHLAQEFAVGDVISYATVQGSAGSNTDGRIVTIIDIPDHTAIRAEDLAITNAATATAGQALTANGDGTFTFI